ncbi:MAG: VCBS repeat-containing protein [Sedimentisphaerales bacterium]|nr:VCBS repeat-containing protein [Sedimentisphaerales bacterium]
MKYSPCPVPAGSRNWLPLIILFSLLITRIPAGTAPETPEDTTGSLARYYGFKDMEILKMEWEMFRPFIADMNNDGLNDLVVVNNRKSRIDLLLQKKDFQPTAANLLEAGDEQEDINDIFGREINWRFKHATFPLDDRIHSLAICDLNQDGRMDMACFDGDNLQIILQEPPKESPGPGDDEPVEPAWNTPRKIDISRGLKQFPAFTHGDLNGDSKEDLALLTEEGVFLLFQEDEGRLSQPVKHHIASSRLRQVDIADVNGDGRNDLIILTAEHEEFPLRIRFQNPDGQLGPEQRFPIQVPSAFEVKKLDESRRSCFFTIAQQSGRVMIYALSSKTDLEEYPVMTYPLPPSEDARNRDIVAGDMDGDGLLDVIASNPSRAEFVLYRSHPTDSLTTPETFPSLKDIRKMCAGDLDRSGKDSLVVFSYNEKLIGISRYQNGRLSYPQTLPILGEPQVMDVVDINGDEKLDLIYIARAETDDGQTQYTLRTLTALGHDSTPDDGLELLLEDIQDKPLDLCCRDIDQDGRIDVIILPPYGPVMLIRQTSPGEFVIQEDRDIHSGLVNNIYPNALSFAPLGDRGNDLMLLAQQNFARALAFDPDTGWHVKDQYQAPDPQSNLTTAGAYRSLQDNLIHIVTYDKAFGKIVILKPQPDGTYRTERQIKVGSINAKKILSGNFGGPSAQSILLCGEDIMMRLPLAAPVHTLRQIANFEPDIKNGRLGDLDVGDVNNDGFPDIVICEQIKNHVQILTFNHEARLVSATKFKVFEEPRSQDSSSFDPRVPRSAEQPRYVLIADVTGDQKPDIILLVHDRLIIYPQD